MYVATQTLAKSIYKIDEKSGKAVEKKEGAWKKALWVWHNVNEHWNYNENDKIIVEAYSNYDEIELCLNGKSIETKKLKDFEDRIYKWIIPYQEGELKVIGRKSGKEDEVKTITTTKEIQKIRLTTDKTTISADGYSVAHIIAQLEDVNGNPVKSVEKEIAFSVEGDVKILGVDNGSAYSVQDYKSNTVKTSQGRCLLLIQSTKKQAKALVKAKAKNIDSNALEINVE